MKRRLFSAFDIHINNKKQPALKDNLWKSLFNYNWHYIERVANNYITIFSYTKKYF